MKKSAIICVLSAGTLWGLMGLFVRTLQNNYGFGALEIVSMRLVVAAIAFIVLSLTKGNGYLKIKICDLPMIFLMGFSGIMLMAITYFLSMTYSSLAVAAILLYTAPIIVMIVSLFLFKEKLTTRKIIAVISAFSGFVLVSGIIENDSRVTVAGVVLGLLSGITYASYSIFGTYALKKNESLKVTTWAFIFAALSSLFFSDITDIVSKFSFYKGNIELFVLVITMGICTAFLPFLLYTKGLSRMQASKAIILASVEPLVAAVTGIIVYNEQLTLYSAVGMVLILASVVLTSVNNK